MDPVRAKNLVDYCKQENLTFFELTLKCLFCNFVVSLPDLASFHCKQLALVYRNNIAFAACSQCLRLSAAFETQRYYTCSIRAGLLSDVIGRHLSDIPIRCEYCLQLLDYIEKFDCIYRSGYFHLVRGNFRGCCRNCYQYDE
uniref:Protein E6 n=1 Tax=Human papillomavirus TaxID=10566 RepID=A0A385PLJ7_9PAPI|nr:MAG: E6 protein [Human papillomavirus]